MLWHVDLMVHDHHASWPWHNMALWPRHGDNNEDIANPASLMVYKNILNSLLLNLRIFKFMNILMPPGALRGFEIFTNGPGTPQFLWLGGVQVSCVDTRRMGLSNRILSGLITTAGLVPGSLQHCSNTHLKSLQGPYYEQTSDEYIVTKDYEITL